VCVCVGVCGDYTLHVSGSPSVRHVFKTTYSNQTDTAVCLLADSSICLTNVCCCMYSFEIPDDGRGQQYLFDEFLLLCVQSCTPGDGRKDRPKHVECYSNMKQI